MKGKQWDNKEVERLLELHSSDTDYNAIAATLAEEFGRRMSGDSVYMKLKRLGVLGTNGPKSFEELVEVEKGAARDRQQARAERREIQELARWENFCEMIKDAITPLDFKYKPRPQPKAKSRNAEQAVLNISDAHFGKKTSKYDMKIGEKRFTQLVDSVIDIISIHRQSYPIDILNVFWEGDILDGENIFRNQAHYLDAHVVDQIFKMAPPVTDQLARLANEFKQVNHVCVRGNHGRVSKDSHDDANFDRIFYKVLETATRHIPNMTWSIPEGWHAMTKIYDTRFLIIHGNQIKMTLNLPWYGITTRVSRWAATEDVSAFDVVCMGHFHSSSVIRWSQKRIFSNGTFVAGDQFALEMLGLESSQSQWLFGVHPKRGTTWDYEIRFD